MKKKFVLVIIALTSVWGLSGQSLNLLNSNKLWSNLISWGTYLPNCCSQTDFIKFSGDTTIESITYKKVIQSYDSLKSNWKLIGFVREEPQSGLYFRNLDEQEGLLYKYNLQLKDTFTIVNTYLPLMVQSIKVFVKDIDSVEINGSYKRRYLVGKENIYATDTLIEDLGSTQGIMFPCCFLILYKKLLCYYENDVLVYKNRNFERCYYNTLPTNINQVESRQFKIYPNPVIDELTIEYSDSRDTWFNLDLFDLSGKLVNTRTFCPGDRINLSFLRRGLYPIIIYNKNKLYYNGNIYKN